MEYTTIAGRQVLVEDGPRTLVHFKVGCNPADPPGDYNFWTMKNEKGMRHFGRRPAGREPEERFNMMAGNPDYAEDWRDAQTAVIVRPTSREELIAWLNKHPEDAPCAGRCIVRGEPMIVVERNGKYDLKPASIGT